MRRWGGSRLLNSSRALSFSRWGGLMSRYILFGQDMFKLPKGADGQYAILQDALVLDKVAQTSAFLDYDTRIRPGGESYPLPPGLYLCLIFTIPGPPGRGAGTLFTTLRKYDVNKDMSYRSSIGEKFQIAIGESAHALPAQFQSE